MLARGVELHLGEVSAVVAVDAVEVLGILFEEADKIGFLKDRLPRQHEVVAQVEVVDVVAATAHIVVVFALVLLAQHQIVGDHQILAGGVELAGSGTSSPCPKKRSTPLVRAYGDNASTTSIRESGHWSLMERMSRMSSLGTQRPLLQLVDGLVERLPEDVQAVVVQPSQAAGGSCSAASSCQSPTFR